MKNKRIYVRATKKILEYHPDWRAIVGKVGMIIKKDKSSSEVRIFTGSQAKRVNFTIPNDCLEYISEREALLHILAVESDS